MVSTDIKRNIKIFNQLSYANQHLAKRRTGVDASLQFTKTHRFPLI